jgi:hypothetical protein
VQKQRRPKRVATVIIDGRWKRGRRRKRRRDEIEYDLNTVGIRNRSETLGMEEDCIGIQGTQRRRIG